MKTRKTLAASVSFATSKINKCPLCPSPDTPNIFLFSSLCLIHVSYSKNISTQLYLYSLAVSNTYQSCDAIIGLVVESLNLMHDISFFCPRGNDVTIFELINL